MQKNGGKKLVSEKLSVPFLCCFDLSASLPKTSKTLKDISVGSNLRRTCSTASGLVKITLTLIWTRTYEWKTYRQTKFCNEYESYKTITTKCVYRVFFIRQVIFPLLMCYFSITFRRECTRLITKGSLDGTCCCGKKGYNILQGNPTGNKAV